MEFTDLTSVTALPERAELYAILALSWDHTGKSPRTGSVVSRVCGQGRASWVKRRRGTAGTPPGHDPYIVSSLSRRLMD